VQPVVRDLCCMEEAAAFPSLQVALFPGTVELRPQTLSDPTAPAPAQAAQQTVKPIQPEAFHEVRQKGKIKALATLQDLLRGLRGLWGSGPGAPWHTSGVPLEGLEGAPAVQDVWGSGPGARGHTSGVPPALRVLQGLKGASAVHQGSWGFWPVAPGPTSGVPPALEGLEGAPAVQDLFGSGPGAMELTTGVPPVSPGISRVQRGFWGAHWRDGVPLVYPGLASGALGSGAPLMSQNWRL